MPFFSSFWDWEKLNEWLHHHKPQMSSVNTNKNQEQSGCEGTVEVVPPYLNDIESFDNPDKYPELEFVVGGMERPLHLHRRILAESSGKVKAMLNERKGLKLE